MPLFEPYRPQLDDGEHPSLVGDLSIRTALSSDVMELAGIEAARQGGERGRVRSEAREAARPQRSGYRAGARGAARNALRRNRQSHALHSAARLAVEHRAGRLVLVGRDRRGGLPSPRHRPTVDAGPLELDRGARPRGVLLLERAQSRQHRFAPSASASSSSRATSRSPAHRSKAASAFCSIPSSANGPRPVVPDGINSPRGSL